MSPPRMRFRALFPPIRGRVVTPPGYMNWPGPPAQIRWTPCRHADPTLFDPLPSNISLPNRAARDDRARSIAYAARYCNGSLIRPACPFRDECLSWALEAKEKVVAGGVEVTGVMIKRYHKAKKEADRAAEATTSPDDVRELAER